MWMLLLLLVSAGLVTNGSAAQPSITLRGNGRADIETESAPGREVKIEALSRLAEKNWELISTVLLSSNKLRWTDPWCGTAPRRFYRITQAQPSAARTAPNFRLTDHLGRSHELHYYRGAREVKGFVLIFAANGCVEIEERLADIQALRQKYESRGLKFWMINSNPADTRERITAEASRLAINFPVLHDRGQAVAQLFKAGSAAEVVCVSSADFGIFYQGSIDDRASVLEGPATRSFLTEALESFLAGEAVAVRQTKPAGCDLPATGFEAASVDRMYSTQVAPLLQSRCVSCHSPGNIAPWAMTNHAVIQAYAGVITEQVTTGQMPPWHADPEFGKFEDDMSLSPDETKMLVAWLQAGAPRGTGPDPLESIPPPPSKWPAELGEPDLILRAPPQEIMAEGVEPYRYVFVPTGLTEDKWVHAAVVRPGNTRVVHHYLVWEGESTFQMAAGLAGYVPGMQPKAFPEGTGIFLRKGASLTFNLHYTPSGQVETDEPELGLWFHKTPPAKELYTLPLVTFGFRIPPGARDHQVVAQLPNATPFDVTIYSMSPHMHLRGARMKFEVVDRNGKRETLLSVPKYDFDWQTGYALETPRLIKAGSRLVVTGAFDNSELNPFNPDPSQSVVWGDQSFEEMFIGYFTFTEN